MTASRDEKIAPQLLPLWKLPKTSGLFTVLRSSVKSGSHVRRSSFSAIRFASDAVMALQLAPTPPTTTSTKRRLGGRRLGGRRLAGRQLGRRAGSPGGSVAGGSVAGGSVAGGWVAGRRPAARWPAAGWPAAGWPAAGWPAARSPAGLVSRRLVAGGSVGSPSHTG